MKKVFIISAAVAVSILLLAVGYYFFWPQDSGEVSLALTVPSSVLVGQPFSVQANFTNNGTQPIKNAKLLLYIPDGMAFVGRSPDVRYVEQMVGDMQLGVVGKLDFSLIATGGYQTVKHIDAKMNYATDVNTKVQFEAKAGQDVEIGQSAITVSFETPEKVFTAQNFDVVVNVENSSDADFEKVRLKMDYAPMFQFGKSDIAPTTSNNYWDLGPLQRGAKKKLTISGNILGSSETFFQFKTTLSADFSGHTYAVAVQDANLAIAPSPLALTLRINGGGPEYIAKIGAPLDYTITYRNNSSVTLENVTLSALLSGELFDFSQARTNGFFNSLNNTFLWNAANTPGLAHVGPGVEGTLDLRLAAKAAFPIRKLSDKNYTLKVLSQIESPTVPENTGASKTVSVASLENKVAGVLQVRTAGYFRDASSGVVNSGQFPPRVNQPTEYSIHWTLKNYATDAQNVRVSAFLQSNTRFIKVVKSSVGIEPKFNAASGEVTWEISSLPATKGVVGDPVEAIFQIENTPAVNQVNRTVPLLGPTTATAEDVFVGQPMQANDDEVTTLLPDDTTLGNGDHSAKP